MKFSEMGIPSHMVGDREVPDTILLENGIMFTKTYFKERENARCYLSEKVLRKMAAEIAEHITIRTYSDGCSHDERRESTKSERDTIYKIAYGALLGLNHGETARKSEIAEDAIINSAEFTLIVMLPGANSYDTIYTPLRKTVANWRNHTEAEINFHYGIC